MISKCDVIADESLKPLCCKLEIETKDGQRLFEELQITFKFYDYPFQKDVELLRGLLPEMKISPQKFEKLVKAVSDFENLDDVSAIMKLVVKKS